MAQINYSRDNNIIKGTNFGKENILLKETNLNNIDKTLKPIIIGNENQIKTENKLDLKSSKLGRVEEIEKDVSMMSINNDSLNCKYHLPLASELENSEVAKKFADDVINRRSNNRALMLDRLTEYKKNIQSVSYDSDLGDALVLEILDYMQELECRNMPLGANFLQGTTISDQQRTDAINWLFNLTQRLGIDRYSVYDGMAIADRYVKAKRLAFKNNDYKMLIVTSWYIACKWDLVEYPYIDDVCKIVKIKSARIIHDWEIEILKTIDFYLGIPNPISFLRPLTLMKQREKISHNIAKCLMEIFLLEYKLAGHPAHIVASASYCLTMNLCFRHKDLESSWFPLIQFAMGLDVEDIRPVIKSLAKILITSDFRSRMPGIYGQYSSIFDVINRRKSDLKAILDDQACV